MPILNRMERNKSIQNNPQRVTALVFPTIKFPDSMHFAARATSAEKAVLTVGGTILSIIDIEGSGEISLPFFGEMPFHFGLANNCDVTITLYTADPTATIVYLPAAKSITWNDVAGKMYYEVVTAGSSKGPVTKTLVYTRDKCGFRRSS